MGACVRSAATVLLVLSMGAASAQQAADPTMPCLLTVLNAPEYGPLTPKISFATLSAPQLVDATRPNSEERAALDFAVQGWQRCAAEGSSWRSQNLPPKIAGHFGRYFSDEVLMLADLYGGGLTYGDFNRRRVAGIQAHRERLQAAVAEFVSEQAEVQRRAEASQASAAEAAANRAHAERLSRQQAALQLILSRPAQQFRPIEFVPIKPLPPQQRTTCQWIGNEFQCVSR